MMDEAAYRRELFEHIQAEVGARGEVPRSGAFCLGDWGYAFHRPGMDAPPSAYAKQSFREDGSAPSKAVDGSFDTPKDRWVFNEDRTLSIWFHVDPMPEYGIDEPTFSEERHNVLVLGQDRFVLFNADGSVVMLYDRDAG